MKLIQKIKNKAPNRYFRKGAATMVTMAVVVAVAIGINVAVGAVPESITKIDMTTGGLYTLGDTTKTVVESLQKPVQIYYLVQDGQQDAAVETLLNRYAQQSKNISWENPAQLCFSICSTISPRGWLSWQEKMGFFRLRPSFCRYSAAYTPSKAIQT